MTILYILATLPLTIAVGVWLTDKETREVIYLVVSGYLIMGAFIWGLLGLLGGL